MATSLQKELEEQNRWQMLPGRRNFKPLFDRILANEFLPFEQLQAKQLSQLQKLLKFCAIEVPYYKKLFSDLGFDPDAIQTLDSLTALSTLSRSTVQQQGQRLHALRLPKGFTASGTSRTSGTTGQPVEIVQTQEYLRAFLLMKQREYRWFRFDPKGKLASIRNAIDLPRSSAGRTLVANETLQATAWPTVGSIFKTGPWLGLADTTMMDDQAQWLDNNRPQYILGQSGLIEQLALAYHGRKPHPEISAIEAISQQLTAEMRYKVETIFKVPVHQNYGLNEIGIIAVRCPEEGRYHVHSEYCMVEIVDDKGNPCGPGQRGRILVTAFNNPAMPLIRYDTDDLAETADGPCTCGRTLPSFKDLHGRYRRTVLCPPDTWQYWDCILATLAYADPQLSGDLRQYQLHQYLDKSFELRLVAKKPLPDRFEKLLYKNWQNVVKGDTAKLTITYVETIERHPGGEIPKFHL